MERLKSSNKRDPKLKINNEQTVIENNNISFHYTEADYAKMIRAYIDKVTSNNHLFLFNYLMSKTKIEDVSLIFWLMFSLPTLIITLMLVTHFDSHYNVKQKVTILLVIHLLLKSLCVNMITISIVILLS